jgi:hypothetical protein
VLFFSGLAVASAVEDTWANCFTAGCFEAIPDETFAAFSCSLLDLVEPWCNRIYKIFYMHLAFCSQGDELLIVIASERIAATIYLACNELRLS